MGDADQALVIVTELQDEILRLQQQLKIAYSEKNHLTDMAAQLTRFDERCNSLRGAIALVEITNRIVLNHLFDDPFRCKADLVMLGEVLSAVIDVDDHQIKQAEKTLGSKDGG